MCEVGHIAHNAHNGYVLCRHGRGCRIAQAPVHQYHGARAMSQNDGVPWLCRRRSLCFEATTDRPILVIISNPSNRCYQDCSRRSAARPVSSQCLVRYARGAPYACRSCC